MRCIDWDGGAVRLTDPPAPPARPERHRPMRLLTHCNTGWLACVEWGTALGIVRTLHERGLIELVYAGETRPLLQGARLTAYELAGLGVDHRVLVDSAGPSVIARGGVD